MTAHRPRGAKVFHQLVLWCPANLGVPLSKIPFISGYLDQQRNSTAKLLGEALAQTIVPSLATADRTEKRSQALIELVEEAKVYAAIAALPYFAFSTNAVLD